MTTQTANKQYHQRYIQDYNEYEPFTAVFVVHEDFSKIVTDPVTKTGSFCGTEHAVKFVQKRQAEHPRSKIWKNCKIITYPVGGAGPVEIVKKVKDWDVGTWTY